MKKRILSLVMAGLLTIGMLAGCTSKEAKEDKTEKTEAADSTGDTKEKKLIDVTLNEVAHSIFYAPMYVAVEEGYFKDEGINLTLVTGFGVNLVVQNKP